MAITDNGLLGSAILAPTSGPAGNTFVITTAVDLDAENFILVGISYDNFEGDFSSFTNRHSGVHGLGIIWELIAEVTESISGVLNSGIGTALWLGKITSNIAAGAELTATLDGDTEHATVGAHLFSVSPGNAIRVDPQIPTNPVLYHDNPFGYPAATISGAYIPKQRLFFRSFSREQSTTNALVLTSGFSLGWDLRSAPNDQLASGNIVGKAEFIVSSNLSETSDPNGSGVLGRMADILVALEEYPVMPRDSDATGPSLPENDVSEVWLWKTLITTSWDSTEQRVRLMPGPIRTVDFRYILSEDEDLLEWMDKLQSSALTILPMPQYQYETTIIRDAIIGEAAIQFNASATQLSVGDTVMLFNRLDKTIKPMTRVISSLDPAYGAVLSTTLTHGIDNSWSICPIYDCYVTAPQLNILSVTGDTAISAEVIDRTKPLRRDGVADLVQYFNSLPIIRDFTLAAITQRYDAEVENFASSFGARLRVSSWRYPRLERSISFLAKNPSTTYDRWMQFFDIVAGAHKPFYISSGIKDLDLLEPYANGDDFIKVVGSKYTTDYEDDPVYQQLSIQFTDGTTVEYLVISASLGLDGNDQINLSADLPDDKVIRRISYLYRVRMTADQVTAKHSNNKTYFSFAIRGTAN